MIEFTQDDIRLLQNAIVLLDSMHSNTEDSFHYKLVSEYSTGLVNITKLLVRVGARVGRMIAACCPAAAAAINAELQVTIPWEEYTDQ